MPIMITLTSAEHGGTATCGTHDNCGPDCGCGCPYTGMAGSDKLALIASVEQRYPEQWLAFVIPPGEDEYAPERGLLVVHSHDDTEVWDAVRRITHNQVVHVYFNGALDTYLAWADAEPEPTLNRQATREGQYL